MSIIRKFVSSWAIKTEIFISVTSYLPILFQMGVGWEVGYGVIGQRSDLPLL